MNPKRRQRSRKARLRTRSPRRRSKLQTMVRSRRKHLRRLPKQRKRLKIRSQRRRMNHTKMLLISQCASRRFSTRQQLLRKSLRAHARSPVTRKTARRLNVGAGETIETDRAARAPSPDKGKILPGHRVHRVQMHLWLISRRRARARSFLTRIRTRIEISSSTKNVAKERAVHASSMRETSRSRLSIERKRHQRLRSLRLRLKSCCQKVLLRSQLQSPLPVWLSRQRYL